MSRIGRAPITVPEGVEVKLDGNTITIGRTRILYWASAQAQE